MEISLPKFAQGITLDQLISLANNHLCVLSSRYELQRSTEQKTITRDRSNR